MTGFLTGAVDAVSGIFGMFGGLKDAKAAASPGIAPLFYQISGYQQQNAAIDESNMLARQSNLAYEQSLIEAAQSDREWRAFRDQQALEFTDNGLTLQGSPLGVLTETAILGSQRTEAIKRRGEEVAGLYEMQGLQMLRQGSAAAFGGFAQALQSNFEAANRSANLRSQAFQTGLSGLKAGISAFGSLGGGAAPGYQNAVGGYDPFTQGSRISYLSNSGF